MSSEVQPSTPGDGQLQTKFVFIDSEAFRAAQFDWAGRRLSKLLELAKGGHIVLLTTGITKREVKAQFRELVKDASGAVNKVRVVLEQLGFAEIIAGVNASSAADKLDAAFARFLTEAQVIEVPVTATVDGLFDDYFAHRPPFGDKKKKAEFPDAAVVASLRSWCESRMTKAYVVSRDPDLKDCCAEGGPLFSSESISDLLTKANATKELYDALSTAIGANEYVSDRLAEQVKEEEINTGRRSKFEDRSITKAEIERVDRINILDVEILDRDDRQFICEVEFEAEIVVELEVEIEGGYGDDYASPYRYGRQRAIHRLFYAEIVVSEFDSNDPAAMTFESIYVPAREIEIEVDEIPKHTDWECKKSVGL